MQNQVLTKTQKKILSFLKEYYKNNSQSPSFAEIMSFLGVSSKGGITQHLGALEKKGFIRRISGAYRGIIIEEKEKGTTKIPLKGNVCAGAGIEKVEENELITIPKKFIQNPSKQYFALKVVGDSMEEDGVYNGEIIVVESRKTADNGDLVVVQFGDNQVTLKYFYKEAGQRIRLEPRNADYLPLYPNPETVEILGLLRGITTHRLPY
jgi:repressor LexA